MVMWTWWDGSLSLGLLLPSVLWQLTLLVWSFDLQKTIPNMTYNVSSGMLNPTQSINLIFSANSHHWHIGIDCIGFISGLVLRFTMLSSVWFAFRWVQYSKCLTADTADRTVTDQKFSGIPLGNGFGDPAWSVSHPPLNSEWIKQRWHSAGDFCWLVSLPRVTFSASAVCLQIQPNKFWNHTNPVYPILADNYWAAMLIPEISDPVYQVSVTIIHDHHHHLLNNWTGAKSFMTGFLRCHSIS